MARINKVSKEDIKKVERGWGCEYWIENFHEYCGKILMLKEGKRSSFHFHMNKIETMYLASGYVLLLLIDPSDGKEYSVDLKPGDKIFLDRGQAHQIIALDDSVLFEFSTFHEEEDSFRIKKGD